MNTEIQFKCY